jgi:hypothetical protein
MKSIHIVFGYTGQYDDYTHWNVCAYLDKEQAKQHCAALKEWAKEKGFAESGPGGWVSCPYDPDCWVDDTGVEYSIEEVSLAEKFNEAGFPLPADASS